ncbi:MAG: VRR-NUC domain-containing protein [Nitrospira sp.]|nr:VRR-NUC domain-containing protein [Nitrospira sp.]
MPKKRLTAEMKSALREMLDGDAGEFKRGTLKALVSRGFVDPDAQLTVEGWKQALVISALPRQCAHLGIGHERLEGLEFNGDPEKTVWKYFSENGYSGSYCEGGALLLLIRAAALETLERLNPFKSRQDACLRFTEAQLKIHENHISEIADAVEHADADMIVRGFGEIYRSLMIQEHYPGLTEEAMVALFNAIGSARLRQFTEAIAEDPYQYRSGWPDLTLTNGQQFLWAEVKTTDKLHMSQITTIHRMKPLMQGTIQVVHLC